MDTDTMHADMTRNERQRKAHAVLNEAIHEVVMANAEANDNEDVEGYLLSDHIIVAHYIKYSDNGITSTFTTVIDRDGDTPDYRILGLLESGKLLITSPE